MKHLLAKYTILILYIIATLAFCNENEIITVTALSGQCLCAIVKDGFTSRCFDEKKIASFDSRDISRYQELAIVLFDKMSGKIVDALIYQVPKKHIGAPIIEVIWPKNNSIVSSSNVDFQYYFKSLHSTDKMVDKNSLICIKVLNIFGEQTKCTSIIANIISIELPTGSYKAVFFQQSLNLSDVQHSGDDSPNILSTLHFSVDLAANLEVQSTINFPVLYWSDSFFVNTIMLPSHEVIHIAIMSCRSEDRYIEVEVLLKSIIFNLDPDTLPIVVHFIVDESGYTFLSNMLNSHSLLEKFPSISYVFHSFEKV